jgi:hypothetical protein
MTLVEFWLARLDEDARAAQAAQPGPWNPDGGSVYASHPTDQVVTYTESAGHIARHDPARVLVEVDAKRRIVAEYQASVSEWRALTSGDCEWKRGESGPELQRLTGRLLGLELAVRHHAAVHAEHPDYDEAWRP